MVSWRRPYWLKGDRCWYLHKSEKMLISSLSLAGISMLPCHLNILQLGGLCASDANRVYLKCRQSCLVLHKPWTVLFSEIVFYPYNYSSWHFEFIINLSFSRLLFFFSRLFFFLCSLCLFVSLFCQLRFFSNIYSPSRAANSTAPDSQIVCNSREVCFPQGVWGVHRNPPRSQWSLG